MGKIFRDMTAEEQAYYDEESKKVASLTGQPLLIVLFVVLWGEEFEKCGFLMPKDIEKCSFWPPNHSEKIFLVKMSFFSLLRKKASFGYCTFAHEIIKEAKLGSLAQLD